LACKARSEILPRPSPGRPGGSRRRAKGFVTKVGGGGDEVAEEGPPSSGQPLLQKTGGLLGRQSMRVPDLAACSGRVFTRGFFLEIGSRGPVRRGSPPSTPSGFGAPPKKNKHKKGRTGHPGPGHGVVGGGPVSCPTPNFSGGNTGPGGGGFGLYHVVLGPPQPNSLGGKLPNQPIQRLLSWFFRPGDPKPPRPAPGLGSPLRAHPLFFFADRSPSAGFSTFPAEKTPRGTVRSPLVEKQSGLGPSWRSGGAILVGGPLRAVTGRHTSFASSGSA